MLVGWWAGHQPLQLHERIKKDITEFPVFRFDWFFESRSPQDLQRRCNTLLGMIEKEETRQMEEAKLKPTKGKVCYCRRCLWFLAMRLTRSAIIETRHRRRSEGRKARVSACDARRVLVCETVDEEKADLILGIKIFSLSFCLSSSLCNVHILVDSVEVGYLFL